jgi:hypothetical protein
LAPPSSGLDLEEHDLLDKRVSGCAFPLSTLGKTILDEKQASFSEQSPHSSDLAPCDFLNDPEIKT